MFHFGENQILDVYEKRILYNNTEWKKDHGASKNEWPLNTKGQSSSKEGDVAYMVGLEWSPLL